MNSQFITGNMELHTVGDENQQLIQPECVKLLIKSQIITSCVLSFPIYVRLMGVD